LWLACRWLYGNKLRLLPADIGRMTQLRKLWLDGNQLTQLPEELGDCTALQVGDVRLDLGVLLGEGGGYGLEPLPYRPFAGTVL